MHLFKVYTVHTFLGKGVKLLIKHWFKEWLIAIFQEQEGEDHCFLFGQLSGKLFLSFTCVAREAEEHLILL